MEKGFLCQQVLGIKEEIELDWKLLLIDDFQNTKFSKSFINCLLIRYFRNYIWLIDLILIVWFYIPTSKFIYYSNAIIVLLQHLFYFRLAIDVPDL